MAFSAEQGNRQRKKPTMAALQLDRRQSDFIGRQPACAAALPSPFFVPPFSYHRSSSAFFGHTASHMPQPVQCSASSRILPSVIEITPYRQQLMHLPQLSQPPVRWAVRGRGGSSSKGHSESSASPHTSSTE